MPWETFEPLATRWAKRFGVPPLLVWSVATVESGRNPSAENHGAGDEKRGGAWGLFQVTLQTARDLFARHGQFLRKFPAGQRFDGSGPSLLDPELNTLLGTYYLAALWKEFQTFDAAAAAYNMGAKPVRAALATGNLSSLPAKGRKYIAEAQDASHELLARTAA